MRCLLVAAVVALAGCAGGDGDRADPVAFCDRLDRLTTNDPFRAFGQRATAAEIEAAFEALVERARELVEVAPAEARAAAREYATAAASLDDLLAEAGYDGSSLDTRAYRGEQVAYAAAAARLERYLRTEC